MSHSGCLCGKLFSCPVAHCFISKWSQLMTASNIARDAWPVDKKAKRKSMVRWGAEYSVIEQVAVHWPSVVEVITAPGDFSPELRASMRAVLTNNQIVDHCTELQTLQLELALVMDCASCVFNLVYDYEGDGLLSTIIYPALLQVHHKLDNIVIHRQPNELPSVRALLSSYFPAEAQAPIRNELFVRTCEKARPVRDKFFEIFCDNNGKSAAMVMVYRCFNTLLIPCNFIRPPHLEAEVFVLVDHLLTHIPYLSTGREQLRIQLQQEYSQYVLLAPTAPQDPMEDILPWWYAHKDTLPSWRNIVEQAVQMHPNSAAAERCFSMYKCMFSEQQESLLEDYKETALMMRYNEHYRQRKV